MIRRNSEFIWRSGNFFKTISSQSSKRTFSELVGNGQSGTNSSNRENSSNSESKKNDKPPWKIAVLTTVGSVLFTFLFNRELQNRQADIQERIFLERELYEYDKIIDATINSPDIFETLSTFQEYEDHLIHYRKMNVIIQDTKNKIRDLELLLDKNHKLCKAILNPSSYSISYTPSKGRSQELLNKLELQRKKLLAMKFFYEAILLTRLGKNNEALLKMKSSFISWNTCVGIEVGNGQEPHVNPNIEAESISSCLVYISMLGNYALIHCRAADAANGVSEKISLFEQARKIYDQIDEVYNKLKERESVLLKDKNIIVNKAIFLRKVFYDISSAERIIYQEYLNSPQDVVVLNAYALLLADKNEFNRAREVMEFALKLTPENPLLQNNLSYIISNCSSDVDDLAYALSLSKDAVNKYPASHEFIFNRGIVYLKSRDYVRALDDLLQIDSHNRLPGEKPYIKYLIGITNLHLGRYEQASINFSSAEKLASEMKDGLIPAIIGMDEYILSKDRFLKLLEQHKNELSFIKSQEQKHNARLALWRSTFNREEVIHQYRHDTSTDNILMIKV